MSVIIALKENERVHLMADTQATIGDTLKIYMGEKIFPDPHHHYFIGCVGEGKFLNTLRYHPFPLYLDSSFAGMSPHEFMVKEFVPALRDVLEPLKKEGDEESGMFNLLVTWASHLFTVQHDGTVLEYQYYAAIGSPQPEAMVALNLFERLSTNYDPERKLRLIMASLEKHCNYIGYPYVYHNTGELLHV